MACMLPVILRSVRAQIDNILTESARLHPHQLFPVTELNALKRIMEKIEAGINDVIERSARDASAKLLLEELMEEAHKADDAIGKFGCDFLHTKAQSWDPQSWDSLGIGKSDLKGIGRSDLKLKRQGGSSSSEFIYRHAYNIEKIWQHFVRIQRDVRLRIDLSPQRFVSSSPQRSITRSSPPYGIVFGREHEKETIIDLGLSRVGAGFSCTASEIHVLPIVGMGGVGKTTIAQLVYNDFRIRQRFDLQGWVHVFDIFSVETLMRDILSSFTRNEVHNSSSLISLQAELSKVVKGRSFFLVLDDLWDGNSSRWELLLSPLHLAQSGLIVVTTRDESVARVTQTMPSFCVKCLSFDNSWSMFIHFAFENMSIKDQAELLDTNKSIVARCGGLPLAIKSVASNLRPHQDKVEWMKFLRESRNEFDDFTEEVLESLRISYDRMPLKLKQCFLFFTLYPKGSTFFEEDLIRLWWASGLLEEMDKDPEDAGSILFEELRQRSIIEAMNTDYGADSGYIMHDLMHDLVMHIAEDDFAIVKHDDLNFTGVEHEYLHQKGARYLSIIVPDLPGSFDLRQFCEFRNLRVLQVSSQCSKWNHAGVRAKIPEQLFVLLNHLRSLIIRDIVIEALPDSVGNLKLLQYLDLTNTSIESIPESVCNLYNLQKLELVNCPLCKFPNGMGNLISLRYLIFNPCLQLPLSIGIGRLTNLKTLSRFEIQKRSSGFQLHELKDLVNLRELYISGLYNVASIREANLANLSSKRYLKVLRLDWSMEPSLAQPESTKLGSTSEGATKEQYAGLDPTFQEQLLDNLKPHTFLKELHIHKYCGSRFPSWLGDASFTALVKVSLIGDGECCKMLPCLGQLPSLDNLAIQSMGNLCCVGHEFCSIDANRKGFLSLKTLEFVDMVKWSSWTGVQSDEFCSLNTLRIMSCPELVVLPEPLSSSLTKLVVKDCDTLARIPNLPTLAFLILAGEVSEDIFTCLNLPMLRSLKVSQSRNIRSLDINYEKFPLLEVLVISGCRNLQHVFGLDGLSSLKILKLSACKNMQFSLREKLPSTLVYLDISYSPKLQQWKEIQGKNYYVQLCNDANDEILKKFEELREAESGPMIPIEEALNIELSRRKGT